MKRPSYKHAIKWISSNDEPTCLDPEAISETVSVLLIADIFGVTPEKVANDVVKERTKEEKTNN